MIKFLEDTLLAALQRRCDHPGNMVAFDLLEGCADGVQVKYCRRCGSAQTLWQPNAGGGRFIALDHCWRRPDPHLWRDPVAWVWRLKRKLRLA